MSNSKPRLAEYVWVDGVTPSPSVRSKIKVLSKEVRPRVRDLPDWGADGSSTNQAEGDSSDIIISPVRVVRHPFLSENDLLVMCDVWNPDGTAHSTNTRHALSEILSKGGNELRSLFGFEQEYTFLRTDGTPYGFPENGFPAPQGQYYCAVGAGNIFGREVYEEFMQHCLTAGLEVSGFNWEVMPGQAEVQVGAADPLKASDHLWLARWILQRTAEKHNIVVSFEPKPARGDWNGAGMHTNFSTQNMRNFEGISHIENFCDKLGERVRQHLEAYGDDYESRLTGAHETCSYRDFKWGVADRTASIRIPQSVALEGKGYLEDRRPNANADPYRVCYEMIKTALL
tara:strand:- start:632 stop:1660 length:1029 start_codon:yes stop_codon:yes gene_type:complete